MLLIKLVMLARSTQGTAEPLGLLNVLVAATDGRTQDGRRHALYLLDLDSFKRVNDQDGHAAGHRVLRVVVERFKSASRPTDFFARLGGDEFAVIAYDVDRTAAAAIGDRLVACFARHRH